MPKNPITTSDATFCPSDPMSYQPMITMNLVTPCKKNPGICDARRLWWFPSPFAFNTRTIFRTLGKPLTGDFMVGENHDFQSGFHDG